MIKFRLLFTVYEVIKSVKILLNDLKIIIKLWALKDKIFWKE